MDTPNPERGTPGRKPALGAQHVEVLRAITLEQPRSSLDEVTRELERRTGVTVCSATVRGALRQAGITRLKPLRKVGQRAAAQGGRPLRVGYTDIHRREDGPSGMNTDLTEAEWALVADLFEHDQALPGRPPKHPRKLIVDACCYVVRTGCAWRLLPKCFPSWQVVYKSFSRWAVAGRFETMHDRLRELWRSRVGREPEPTAAIIDSQSTRSTAQGGATGFDAGKKVKGRKRHIVVDTAGLIVGLVVHAADIQDRDGAPAELKSILGRWPWLRHIFADGGYGGPKLTGALQKVGKFTLQIVRRSDAVKGFEILPRRWVVERTFAWLGRCRRLAKDFERTIASAEAWPHVAHIRLLTRRLARA